MGCATPLIVLLFIFGAILFTGFTISINEDYAAGNRTRKETAILSIAFILIIITFLVGIWAVTS